MMKRTLFEDSNNLNFVHFNFFFQKTAFKKNQVFIYFTHKSFAQLRAWIKLQSLEIHVHKNIQKYYRQISNFGKL